MPRAPARYRPRDGMTILPTFLALILFSGQIGTAMVGGKATYYDDGPGLYGAAGPVLREALGGDPAFRGERVTVCTDDACVTVTLTDWCACGDRGGVPTVIDLSPEAFRRLAPLSAGVIAVTVEPAITLPATDTIPDTEGASK